MLTKVDRQAMRDRLAEAEFKWAMSVLDPKEFRYAKYVRDGVTYYADTRYAGPGWYYSVTRLDGVGKEEQVLARVEPLYPSAESAKSAASSWLTAHLQPNRDDTLRLLDWANEVEEWFGYIRGDESVSLAAREAVAYYQARDAYWDLFGKEEGGQP